MSERYLTKEPKISSSNLYDLEYLEKLWTENGWEGLRTHCRNLDFKPYTWLPDDKRGDPQRLIASTREVFKLIVGVEHESLLYVSEINVLLCTLFSKVKVGTSSELFSSNNVWHTMESGPQVFKKMSVLLNALSEKKTYGEVAQMISSPKAHIALTKHTSKKRVNMFYSAAIPSMLPEAIEPLCKLARQLITSQEAWWSCVWYFLQTEIRKCRDIRTKVREHAVLEARELYYINNYLEVGVPKANYILCPSEGEIKSDSKARKTSFEIVLNAKNEISFMETPEICKALTVMLMHPVFIICQELQERLKPGYYIARCRSPFCQKQFYTGRLNAVACPSQNGKLKSPCQLNWIRYSRWLEKTGKNPEDCWDDAAVRKDFIASECA
jgi:hypothetical protein